MISSVLPLCSYSYNHIIQRFNECRGAGIGGLTFAVSLQDASNVEIDVYESASQISGRFIQVGRTKQMVLEIGAGVGLWPRTWAALKQMGLEPDLTRVIGESSDEDTSEFLCL